MLTRLRVKGFKSLDDVELRFGPLTCVAGVNGVGKSNLFDAILFLKYLADVPFVEAAARIRGGAGRANLSSLFTKTAHHQATLMEFEADFLVDELVVDDFGREAKASVTYLSYKLALKYIPASGATPERMALVSESLACVPKAKARRELGFGMSTGFFNSAYLGASKVGFIGMDDAGAVVNIRSDQAGGRPIGIPIANMGRTVLSNMNTIDRPTVLAARREMQSWLLLQLESSSLRQPDDFFATGALSAAGAHMPATLDRLKKNEEITSRLSGFLPDVANVFVDVDEKRQLKTLLLETGSGIRHEARALSDGTLRFLALSILGADPAVKGLLCLEEPENGIHPAKIAVVVELLKQMVVDPDSPIGADNPLRQVIVNTHSPLLVQRLRTDEIIVSQMSRRDGASLSSFSPLVGTWRDKLASESGAGVHAVAFGALLAYLTGDDPADEVVVGKENVKQEYRRQVDVSLG
jgi:predicted ATPase